MIDAACLTRSKHRAGAHGAKPVLRLLASPGQRRPEALLTRSPEGPIIDGAMAVLRRGFLLGVPSALALPLAARTALARERGASQSFADLKEGSRVGPWVVDHVGPMARGGRVLLLRGESDGAEGRFELEVLLGDPNGPTPPGRSGHFAVFVRNSGNGSTATVEDHGLAAMTLASHLAAHEARIDRSRLVEEGWLTMRERTEAFASELDGRR